MDQLKRQNAMINLKNDELYMDDDSSEQAHIFVIYNWIQRQRNFSTELEVRCRDEVVIPANCTVLACSNLRMWKNDESIAPDLFGSDLIVEMGDKARLRLPEGLWIARSLVTPDELGRIQVAILNPTNDIITLEKGTKLATAFKLESFALSMSTMSTSNLKVDDDGWLYLGGGKPAQNPSEGYTDKSEDTALRSEILKQVNPKLPEHMKKIGRAHV